MLPPLEVTRQIIASRKNYAAAVEARRRGVYFAETLSTVQEEIDTLTTLLDESPETVHWKINGLIEEFEALAGKLVN
jgi:hypothetical protein